ncbi:unnamed protein product [Fraxinus pennsylvanica]|uniref:Uncharacterized protein n=1 Tax=Fraxinus pennsylvanica TaxID=56036 RepID=A0AAD2ECD0_9LAMI|nr:unnamed protein product [Fraxinus pennsylvanica]
MATSIFMASDHSTNTNPQPSIHLPEDDDHQPIRRGSGRRRTKGNESTGQKKKQPQRGMGVAQLERLRVQEGWKNPTNQTLTINPASLPNLAVMNPNSVPMQFAKLGGFGTVNGNGNVGHMGLNQNPGFFGFQEQFQVDPFGVGGSKNSKELSSTPNGVKCYYGHCNVCHKKKRVNGEILGCSRAKSGMYMQMSPMGNCDFLGLNVGDNPSINQENQEVGTQAPIIPHPRYSVRNCQSSVEVVAFHRKGNSSTGNGTLMMEYEFFPGSRSTCNNEVGTMNLGVNSEASSYADGERETCFDASTSLDLSLKLSY